jgi:hypothetical protein
VEIRAALPMDRERPRSLHSPVVSFIILWCRIFIFWCEFVGLENSPLLILLMIVCSSAFASSVSSSRRATSRLTELGYA